MYCSNCGCEINENSRFCVKCGEKIDKDIVIRDTLKKQIENKNKIVYTKDNIKPKKKESKLSVIACVLAIFTITIFPAVIIALIDIFMEDEEKGHSGSWCEVVIAIILVIIEFVL